MFTIDLLKGQGLPIKRDVTTVTIIGVGFGIPAVLLMLMIGSYFHSKVIIKTQSRVLRNYETGFANLKADLERQRVQEVQCLKFASCLEEAAEVLSKHVQWSQVLMLLSEHLPESLVVDRLEVKVKMIPKIVCKKSDSTRKVSVFSPARTLSITMRSASGYSSDQSVKQFQKRLANSDLFKAIVKDVVISSRQPSHTEGKDVVCYELNCAFKIN